jgi:quercetin dioxygenase-like cupin family protein
MYFSGESHKYHEVVFVMDGEVTISEDDRIYYLSKGDLIVHAPYEFHRIATDKGAQILLFSFDTDEAFPDKLYDGFFVLSEEEKIEF